MTDPAGAGSRSVLRMVDRDDVLPLTPPGTWVSEGLLNAMNTWTLSLRTPNGYRLCTFVGSVPDCLANSPNGGVARDDHRRSDGTEFFWFDNSHPHGEYNITVKYFSGS